MKEEWIRLYFLENWTQINTDFKDNFLFYFQFAERN
jgi:hypothetical protein